ncbi:HPr family phosphocarrier protein [Salinithrix halophila]|uniref:HPr family phosphocarrier protein n=2 Tax=Salinithrix halophila TaxID=1485204 RepID=A0ABV8JK92_9BACL
MVLLFAMVPSSTAVGSLESGPEALIIRADRIESKGLLLGLRKGNHGLVLNLKIRQANLSGMEMAGSYRNSSSRWNLGIQDPGPVSIQGLSVNVSAIGFKIKPGDFIQFEKPMQIGSLMPAIVLHDVYLRVEKMEAEKARMPALDLEAGKEVSLAPPDGGLFIDLRGFSSMGEGKAEDTINDMLAQNGDAKQGKPTKKPDKKAGGSTGEEPSKGPEEPDEKGDLPEKEPKEPPPGDGPDQPGPQKERVVLKRYFPALEIVGKARKYDSRVILIQGKKEYDAKDWGRVFLMKRFSGTEMEITAEGTDAEKAVKELAEWFGEK